MKKISLILIAAVLALTSIFTLAGCGTAKSNKTKDSTETVSADTKDESMKMLLGYFDKLFENPDVVITHESEGEIFYTQHIKGTDSYIEYNWGTKTYAFKQDDAYIYATETDDARIMFTTDESKSYYSDTAKDFYDMTYEYFFINFSGLSYLDGTFSSTLVSETKDGKQTSKLTFKLVYEEGTLDITAEAADGLVSVVNYKFESSESSENNQDLTWKFAYGVANVSYPDIDAWILKDGDLATKIQANLDAIALRDAFMYDVINAENIKVTMTTTGFEYVETIANEIDVIDCISGEKVIRTYTYVEQADGNELYYFVVDRQDNEGATNGYYLYSEEKSAGFIEYSRIYYSEDFGFKIGDEEINDTTIICSIEDDTMTYTVDRGELGKTTVFAVKEDDYVISATVTNTLPDVGDEVMTFTFEYDVEGFEKPDLSLYTSANDEAMG